MKLSKPIAEKVAKEMMKIIPYNINVMDESGIIIGSGDKKRIGTLHMGASKVIASKKIFEVYNDGDGMKPGVNEPIIFENKIIGVIGITGHPDEVRPFIKLVGVTAKLLIEQESINRKMQNEKLDREKFYHELSHRRTSYDDEFLQQGKRYGMDLTNKCQVILIKGKKNSKSLKVFFERFRHYFSIDHNKTVFFILENQSFHELLKVLKNCKDIEKIGIGEKEEFASISLEQASNALSVGVKIKPSEKVYFYNELKLFILLTSNYSDLDGSLVSVLEKSGNKLELIQTLQVFIEQNGDINNVANTLNIHRNTLNYRLEKIQTLTGKNPKVFLDLFELICSIIWYK